MGPRLTSPQQFRRAGIIPAVALGFLVVLLTGLALTLVELNGGDISNSDTTGSGMLALSFGLAGAFLVSRRPRNVIGWILLVSGVFAGMNAFSAEYPRYALVVNPDASLPAGAAVAWLGSWVWAVGAAGNPLIIWLFPTGRSPAGWRWLGWLIAAGVVLAIVPMAIATWQIAGHAIRTGEYPDQVVAGVPATLTTLGTVTLGLTLLLAVASAVVRFRRARLEERQQQKWLAWAGLLTLIVLVTASPASPFDFEGVLGEVISGTALIALPSIPAAITLAILRYRLYDIDRIISRTVTYALVVGLLGLVILGLITGMAIFLPSDDPLVVAVATLTVFALFNPVRHRVQGSVDRRFNRSRYDAARVIDDFTGSLQDRVDPEGVVGDWVGVVEETMQPAAVGVWVRQP